MREVGEGITFQKQQGMKRNKYEDSTYRHGIPMVPNESNHTKKKSIPPQLRMKSSQVKPLSPITYSFHSIPFLHQRIHLHTVSLISSYLIRMTVLFLLLIERTNKKKNPSKNRIKQGSYTSGGL